MELKQLEYFLCLADTSSFSKASEILFISRQGLSKNLAMLEKELGVTLFRRTNTGLELTNSGHRFRAFAARVMEDYCATLQDLNNAAAPRLHIRFAAPYGFFANFSMGVIDEFFIQHPELRYSTVNFADDELQSQFSQGDLDFAFTSDPVRYPQYEYHPLFRNYRCIVVNQRHPLSKQDYIRTTDLKDIQIGVCAPSFFDYPWLLKRCSEAGFSPMILPIRDSLTMFQYAHQGQLPTLMIGNISARTPAMGDGWQLFWAPEELEQSAFDVSIITRKGQELPPPVRQLIRHIQKYCRQQLEQTDYYPFNHKST